MKENTPEVVRPQHDDDYIYAAHVMERIGGSFAAHIARAYFAADSGNRARLRAAFPDLFTRYFNVYVNHKE